VDNRCDYCEEPATHSRMVESWYQFLCSRHYNKVNDMEDDDE
jgi:hypothetical protein